MTAYNAKPRYFVNLEEDTKTFDQPNLVNLAASERRDVNLQAFQSRQRHSPTVSAYDKEAMTLKTGSGNRLVVKLNESIGAGRYATVYRGQLRYARRDGMLNVAVKIANDDKESKAELENEMELLQQLDTVDKVISLLDECTLPMGETAGVFELADRTLAHVLFSEEYSLDLVQALNWGIQLHTVIQSCVDHDIAHLDIKPQNILLVHDDLRLADFGNAQRISSHQPLRIGTLAYTPPELLFSNTPKFDRPSIASYQVYSAAATMYAILTGQVPFSCITNYGIRLMMALKQGFFVGDHNCWPQDRMIPAALRSLIEMCTDRDPTLRPSPGTVVRELKKILTVIRGEEHG